MTPRWSVSAVVVAAGLVCGGVTVPGAPSERTSSTGARARASFQEGYRHQQAKRYTDAVRAYEASLQLDPNQAEALSNLGFCYKSLKRYQKAVGFYQDAIRLKPDLAEAHEYLGEAYLELGKLVLAEREYTLLLKLNQREAGELKEKIDAKRAGTAPPAESDESEQH